VQELVFNEDLNSKALAYAKELASASKLVPSVDNKLGQNMDTIQLKDNFDELTGCGGNEKIFNF
jgi:hypothetical protein